MNQPTEDKKPQPWTCESCRWGIISNEYRREPLPENTVICRLLPKVEVKHHDNFCSKYERDYEKLPDEEVITILEDHDNYSPASVCFIVICLILCFLAAYVHICLLP